MKPYINKAAVFFTAAAISIPSMAFSAESAQDVAAEIAGNQKKVYEADLKRDVKDSAETAANEAAVGLPNPMVEYPAYGEAAKALGFPLLALPEMTGYQCRKIYVIGGSVGEIRYGRKWEPEVNLTVRSYKLAKGEALRDITGIYDVEWRKETVRGLTVYVAKAGDNSYAATWAVEPYIFAAYGENIAYTPFVNVVANGLIEMSSVYYKDYTPPAAVSYDAPTTKAASTGEQANSVKEASADKDKSM